METDSSRIHILGTGSIGKFVAHSLRSAPEPPPVSLIFHRPQLIQDLETPSCDLTVRVYDKPITTGPFQVELGLPTDEDNLADGSPTREDPPWRLKRFISNEKISALILTVKAHQSVSALKAVKHRLDKNSTVLFLQNGMGIIEDVNEHVWPKASDRPTYMLGINSHGVFARGTFEAVHAGHGFIYMGTLPSKRQRPGSEDTKWPQSATNLLRSMTRVPILGTVALPPMGIFEAQLEKLCVNCVINPLTVLLDSRNGSLLENFNLIRVMRLLLAELSVVIQAMPEIKNSANAHIKFSPARLETLVLDVAKKTANNISSMLQDTRRGSQTEIDYINGYIVKRGEEFGIKPVMNYLITNIVKGKQQMIFKEVTGYMPQEDQLGKGEESESEQKVGSSKL